jgi:hypothetical protein
VLDAGEHIYAYTDPQTVFRTRSQAIKKGEAPEAW